jgi:hypothetical protein
MDCAVVHRSTVTSKTSVLAMQGSIQQAFYGKRREIGWFRFCICVLTQDTLDTRCMALSGNCHREQFSVVHTTD